jgi:hypothetical protein
MRMREFLRWLAQPSAVKLLNAVLIWFVLMLAYMVGSLLVLVFALGVPLLQARTYLFPFGLRSAYLFILFFAVVGFYIHYLLETRRSDL